MANEKLLTENGKQKIVNKLLPDGERKMVNKLW